MYDFILAEDKNYSDHICWYLKITKGMFDKGSDFPFSFYPKLLADIMLNGQLYHDGIKQSFNKSEIRRITTHEMSYPELHAKTLIDIIERGLKPIMQRRGGWRILNDNIEILKTIRTRKFEFPKPLKEIITISKFANGSHFYLNSNIDRKFNVNKFNTIKLAETEAKKFANSKHIINKGII